MKPIPDDAAFPGRDQPVTVQGFMEYVEIKKAGGPDHELKKDFQVQKITLVSILLLDINHQQCFYYKLNCIYFVSHEC